MGDDELYYECFSMYDEPDQSLDIIQAADQFWSTVEGPLLAHELSSPIVDTVKDTSFLDDLNAPCLIESEYWDDFITLDDPFLHILAHSVTADAVAYNIDSGDILDAMAPVQPRITKPTAIDYESKRPYFGWLPLERVKRTFEQCTQHMRLPPSTQLQKQFCSPNPGASIFHRCEADATDMI